jgi:hypothetical protein
MQTSKIELEATLTKNHYKLNSSFSEYFRNEIHAGRDMQLQKKVTKLKKIEDQREQMIETPPV